MKKYIVVLSLMLTLFLGCSKDSSTVAPNNVGNTGTGKGGSLARFTIAFNHLYVVDDETLYTYSLANSKAPVLVNSSYLGFNVETIYPYKDKIFIGSQNAMYVYSISNPADPEKVGEASHIRACDPVVADDDVAYVTVRSGSTCGGTINALLVYDITSVFNPSLIKQVPLSNPWGLGMDDDRLYVCDGNDGLIVFDISDNLAPVFIKKITGDSFYDVIVLDKLLICMIDGGTAIFELGANDQINKLATITE